MRSLLVCLLMVVGLCGPVTAEPLKIFAAASLKTAIDDVNAQWTSASQHDALGVYAATPALAKQIAEGAPADIFISADLAWMDDLEKKSLIKPETRRNLLGNSLVLIAPAESGLKLDLKPGVDLVTPLGGGRLAIGETKAVPAGRYAKAALESLGIWDALKYHLAEQVNVRAALQLVAHGEAPLGIVYASDAVAETGIEIAGVFPASSHPPIVYPVAVVAASDSPLGADYLAFLTSPAAAEIFARNGFTVLR